MPELGQDDCWFFVNQSSLCPQRLEVRRKKWKKMFICFVVQPLQSREENEIWIYVKNVMIHVFLALSQWLQERNKQILLLLMRKKVKLKKIAKFSNNLSCGELFSKSWENFSKRIIFIVFMKYAHVRPCFIVHCSLYFPPWLMCVLSMQWTKIRTNSLWYKLRTN